jgi:hypothetical protein
MGVSHGRSQISDLSFQVFNRAIHPDWFATRVHRRIPKDLWEADVRIIEGGHAVIFGAGPIRLAEVLSGPETLLPEPGVLFRSSIKSEGSTILRAGGLIEYQTCFEVERVDREVFQHLCEELQADASRDSLVYHFRSQNRFAPRPLSHVHIDSRKQGISIQSTHTFPEEFAFVRTLSLYERTAIS